MSPIVPAVIPTSIDDIASTIERITPFTHEMQIDIVDGVFVPFTSWPYKTDASIADLSQYTKEKKMTNAENFEIQTTQQCSFANSTKNIQKSSIEMMFFATFLSRPVELAKRGLALSQS